MRIRNRGSRGRTQAGFSMIEMLMTAFVLAVGILGLTLLQAMSLKASRGSRSMATAVLVADQVMDQVEMEGRLSWLNLTDPQTATPSLADLKDANLKYIVLPSGPTPLEEKFNSLGGAVDTNATDPVVSTPFYTVKTNRVTASAVQLGTLSDFTVQVQFADQTSATNAPITRTVTICRRVLHG